MLYIFLTALKTVLVADTEGTNSQDSSIFQVLKMNFQT